MSDYEQANIPGSSGNVYYDSEGNECGLYTAVKREPEWACSRIREGEKAIAKVTALKAENATLEAENAKLRDAMHEIYGKTCLALDRAEWRDSEDYSYLYSVNKEIRDITLNWPGRTMEGGE